MNTGPGCPALADIQRLAALQLAYCRVTALYPAPGQKALCTVWHDPLQIHQQTIGIQWHQQHVTSLAQPIGLDALAGQVWMIGACRFGVTPDASGPVSGGGLVAGLFGFPLHPCALNALGYQLRFQWVGWLAAAPGAG